MGKRPRSGVASLLAAAILGGACASLPRQPGRGVQERARAIQSYSAELRVRLRGPELRARAPALVAFERPSRLRIEVPGPSGARFVALASDDRLVAVFPAERAVFRGAATAAGMERLTGVALAPPELMDLLVGVRPERARSFSARWGARLPARIDVTLADGSRLELRISDAEADVPLPALAFSEPDSRGYRAVDAGEARELWSR